MSLRALRQLLPALLTCALFTACGGDTAETADWQGSTYTSASTPIGVMLDDPEARAILEGHIPGFTTNSRTGLMRNTTLKGIQGYAASVLTDEVLAAIDADLAQLTPRASSQPAAATDASVNFDESRVAPYSLPPLLQLDSGTPVQTPEAWWNLRRPEILEHYASLVFGKVPAGASGGAYQVLERDAPALGGTALRSRVTIQLAPDPNAPAIELVKYIPADAEGPVPLLLMLDFTSPAQTFQDGDLPDQIIWDPFNQTRVPASSLASLERSFDPQAFLSAGFGLASYYYGDVEADFSGDRATGIRRWYSQHSGAGETPDDAWGAMAAWAWSLRRVQDYLEQDGNVDASRVALFGASRLASVVLWAAAQDQRFAAVITCCSNKLGAGILRRNYGEVLAGMNAGGAQHWVAGNLAQFHGREDELPVDGHLLLAAIAPRPVLIQAGARDHAADPKGSFLAAVAAQPVYTLLGGEPLGSDQWPPPKPILNDQGFYLHDGGHAVTADGWAVYLEFLQKHLQ